MAIFGLHACDGQANGASVEPVWVNGVMGVYVPNTQIFVPHNSPVFDQTCDLILQNRDDSASQGRHHWFYFPTGQYFSYSSGGASGLRSYGGQSFAFSNGESFGGHSSEGFSPFHFGSIRGGFGHAGHGHGGGE